MLLMKRAPFYSYIIRICYKKIRNFFQKTFAYKERSTLINPILYRGDVL